MVVHLSALLVIQVTASQNGLRGATSLPELGHYKPNCKEEPIFCSAVYYPCWLPTHPSNKFLGSIRETIDYFETSPSLISSVHIYPQLTLQTGYMLFIWKISGSK
jgi:hypothetical protein